MAGQAQRRAAAALILSGMSRATLARGRAALDRGDLDAARRDLARARGTLLLLESPEARELAEASDALDLAIDGRLEPWAGAAWAVPLGAM